MTPHIPGGMIPRRRSKHSLYGNPAGLEMSFRQGGSYPNISIPKGVTQEQYDPGPMFYANHNNLYESPPTWFEGHHVAPTPALRFNPPDHFAPPVVKYEQSLMTDQMTQEAFQEAIASQQDMTTPLHGTPTEEQQVQLEHEAHLQEMAAELDALPQAGPIEQIAAEVDADLAMTAHHIGHEYGTPDSCPEDVEHDPILQSLPEPESQPHSLEERIADNPYQPQLDLYNDLLTVSLQHGALLPPGF